jgi:predicted transcriptional regulator
MLKPMEDQPTPRTKMMMNGRTSHKNFKEYYTELSERGLIKETNNLGNPLGLTERGLRFVSMYEQLMAIFNEK